MSKVYYDTYTLEKYLENYKEDKNASPLIDGFIKGAFQSSKKKLKDRYLTDFTGTKIDFGDDILIYYGETLKYKGEVIKFNRDFIPLAN